MKCVGQQQQVSLIAECEVDRYRRPSLQIDAVQRFLSGMFRMRGELSGVPLACDERVR